MQTGLCRFPAVGPPIGAAAREVVSAESVVDDGAAVQAVVNGAEVQAVVFGIGRPTGGTFSRVICSPAYGSSQRSTLVVAQWRKRP